jgi:hypothetical protein
MGKLEELKESGKGRVTEWATEKLEELKESGKVRVTEELEE